MAHRYKAKFNGSEIIFELDNSLVGHQVFGKIKLNVPNIEKIKLNSLDLDYLLKKNITNILIVPAHFSIYQFEKYKNKMHELDKYYMDYDKIDPDVNVYDIFFLSQKNIIYCWTVHKYIPNNYSKQIDKDNESLRELNKILLLKIQELNFNIQELTEKYYRPGNTGYLKAKESYDRLQELI